MKILVTYPDYIGWRVSLKNLTSGMDLFHGSALKHLKKAFVMLEASTFRFVFEAADAAYIQRFAPLHQTLMKEKGSSFEVDFGGLQKKAAQAHYGALSLYDGEHYLGGMLYNIRTDFIGLMYRVLPHKIELNLPTSLAKMSDVLLLNTALQIGMKYYSLGKGKNPFGLHASIGLASYKMISKAQPYIPMSANLHDQFDWDLKSDILIFSGEQLGSYAKKATLLVSNVTNLPNYQFLQQANLELKVISAEGEIIQW